MPPTKRAAGDGGTPPPGRRPRATEAASGSSNPEPPPSPGKRFRAIVLVVLFFKRPKGRSTDSVLVALERIGRLEVEVGRLRHSIGQVRDTLGPLLREQEHIKNLIHALTSRLDNIEGPYPNYHNHERLIQVEELTATGSERNNTIIRLRFLTEIKPPVYQGDEINSIRIGIFDGNTMIKSGPFSKLKVKVLALEGSFPYDAEGSWTPEEFHEHRAYSLDGEGNVLAGKGINTQLTNGECHLGSIRFQEGSCRARNKMFIIGARVCDGQEIGGRVQEAVMNPVVVMNRRNKYNEKSKIPNLNDGVYRLKKIAKKGKHRKRLEKEKIFTVEHFLKALHKDEDNLARILQIDKTCKDWEKMVKHAQECSLEGRPELKSYRCAKKNVVLFFNYVHRLVGAKFGGRYIASDMFGQTQQKVVDEFKKHAYDQLDGLTEDHIMRDNIPVPIDMDIGAIAGPSCIPSATQNENSGYQFAVHQVGLGGTSATEVLIPHVPTESLRVNPNSSGSRSSISDPHSTQNYQVGGIPAASGLGQELNESQFEMANNDPRPSFSISNHLGTQNYQDQGAGLACQEQHFSDVLNDLCLDTLVAQAFPFEVPDIRVNDEDGEAFPQPDQADDNSWGAPILRVFLVIADDLVFDSRIVPGGYAVPCQLARARQWHLRLYASRATCTYEYRSPRIRSREHAEPDASIFAQF